MAKRIAIGALAAVVFVVTGFLGYGWWTRRGAPSFSHGGAFGVVASASAEPSASGSTQAPAGKNGEKPTTKTSRPGGGTEGTDAKTPTTTATRAPTPTVVHPKPGRYRFQGSGSERIEFSATSPCSWNIDEVMLTVNDEPSGSVFDWEYSEAHQERVIEAFKSDGIYTVFAGAAVTCLGIRETTQDSYDPHALRIRLPLTVGDSWAMTARAGGRTEKVSGKTVKKETITVPAGTFDVYRVDVAAKLSGSQEGEYSATVWFAPSLGMSVKQVSHTDARQGNAHFTSDMTVALAEIL